MNPPTASRARQATKQGKPSNANQARQAVRLLQRLFSLCLCASMPLCPIPAERARSPRMAGGSSRRQPGGCKAGGGAQPKATDGRRKQPQAAQRARSRMRSAMAMPSRLLGPLYIYRGSPPRRSVASPGDPSAGSLQDGTLPFGQAYSGYASHPNVSSRLRHSRLMARRSSPGLRYPWRPGIHSSICIHIHARSPFRPRRPLPRRASAVWSRRPVARLPSRRRSEADRPPAAAGRAARTKADRPPAAGAQGAQWSAGATPACGGKAQRSGGR